MWGAGSFRVGAVFPDEESAAAAADSLRASGFPDGGVTTAVWTDQGFVIEDPAGRDVRRCIALGALLGTVVLATTAALVAAVVWPSRTPGIVFAMAGVGVLAGVMLGSYVGLVLGHPQRRVTRDWSHFHGVEGEVLLLVDPGGRPDEAAAVLTSHANDSAGPLGGPG